MICPVCKLLLSLPDCPPYYKAYFCEKCEFQIYFNTNFKELDSIWSVSFKTNSYKLNIFFDTKTSYIFNYNLELICQVNDIVFLDTSLNLNSQIENILFLS